MRCRGRGRTFRSPARARRHMEARGIREGGSGGGKPRRALYGGERNERGPPQSEPRANRTSLSPAHAVESESCTRVGTGRWPHVERSSARVVAAHISLSVRPSMMTGRRGRANSASNRSCADPTLASDRATRTQCGAHGHLRKRGGGQARDLARAHGRRRRVGARVNSCYALAHASEVKLELGSARRAREMLERVIAHHAPFDAARRVCRRQAAPPRKASRRAREEPLNCSRERVFGSGEILASHVQTTKERPVALR